MGRIFWRQIHDNFRSLRFQLGLVALLLFFAINGVVYSWKMEQQIEEDARIQADVERIYEEAQTVDAAAQRAYKVVSRPLGTEFMAEAGFNWFHDTMWVAAVWPPVRLDSMRTTNNWMRRFELLDWTVIVRYVLSFLCVVLAYNAVSGEAESGTLQMVLSNPVSRGTFLGGKLLAHLATLLVATAVGSLVSLLILSLHGVLELDGSIAQSYLFFLVGTAAYVVFFLLIGTGISVLTRSSASSLVFMVTAWTLVVVVVPQTAYLVAVRVVGAEGDLAGMIRGYEQQQREVLVREGLFPRPLEIARVDGFALEKRFERRFEELAEEGDRMVRQVYRGHRVQYDVARTIHLVSPGYAFQYAVEALLGAGVERFQRFHEQGYRYRESLKAFLRERDATDPESPHVFAPVAPGFLSTVPLAAGDIPRFAQTELSLADRLEAGTVPISVLLLETGLAFLFAVVAFQRAEVGG